MKKLEVIKTMLNLKKVSYEENEVQDIMIEIYLKKNTEILH